MHSRSYLASLPLALLPLVHGQDIPMGQGHSNIQENPLFSCLELACPVADDSSTFCQLYNQTLLSIGMAQSEARAVAPGANYTWAVGNNNHYDRTGATNDFKVERVFYHGKQFAEEETTHGCAFYMAKKDRNANIFPPPAPLPNGTDSFRPETDPSFCRATYLAGNNPDIPGGCTKALSEIFQVEIAKMVNNQSNQTEVDFPADTCDRIAEAVMKELAEGTKAPTAGCNITMTGPDEAYIRGYPLTGENKEEPIPTSPNASWACYPTLPRTNDLTRVFSYNITADNRNSAEVISAVEGETPVWTGYWKKDGNGTKAQIDWQDVFVDMLCLRTVDMNSKKNEMMSNGSDGADGEPGAANALMDRRQVWTSMGFGMVVALAAYMW